MAAWEDRQPTSLDYLKPQGFKFSINRIPQVEYSCQSVSLPSITSGFAELQTPNLNIPLIGDKLEYDPLTIRFIVMEDMSNYREVHSWLRSMNPFEPTGSSNPDDFSSDASLVITTNKGNANVVVRFFDMYPIALSGLEFDINQTGVEYMTANLTFKFAYFDIDKL